MHKWPKTVLEWVHLFWMLMTGIVVLILVSIFAQMIWLGSDFKQWDFLAFTGSIIGGIITWIGVRATIKHSENLANRARKDKEVEEATVKTRILDKMQLGLKDLRDFYWITASNIEKNQMNTYEIKNYLATSDKTDSIIKMREIVDLSIRVDAETYKALVPLEKLLSYTNHRDRMHMWMLNTGECKTDEVVKEMLSTLLMLRTDTEKVMEAIKLRRREYLKIIFPDDDPNVFLDLEAI